MISPTFVSALDAQVRAIWIFSAEIEEVHTRENGEKATEKRDGVYGVCSVEAAKEDEGGEEGESGKGNVVQRVDTTHTLAS